MNQIGWPFEVESPIPKRVLRPRRHDGGETWIIGSRRGRRGPCRILPLADHLGFSQGCIVTLSSDTDGETPRMIRIREIIEPLIREIYHDAFAGRSRKDVAVRQDDLNIFRGNPGVDVRICGNQFHVAEPPVPREVDKRVVGAKAVSLGFAQHILRSRFGGGGSLSKLERRTRSQQDGGNEGKNQGTTGASTSLHRDWV